MTRLVGSFLPTARANGVSMSLLRERPVSEGGGCLTLFVVAMTLARCDPKALGRPCDLGVADTGSGAGATATINDQVLACPTRSEERRVGKEGRAGGEQWGE